MTNSAEMTDLAKSPSLSPRRAWLLAGAVVVLVLGGLMAGVALLARRAEPFMRERIVATL